MRVYVDPNTSLVRYAREFGGNDTFEFRDYRRVGAFTLPFEVLHDGSLSSGTTIGRRVVSVSSADRFASVVARCAVGDCDDANAAEPIVDVTLAESRCDV